MVKKGGNKRIAIVCQGGGSHTAFTAGALKRILKENHNGYEVMGFSGTSGGAISALLAWYGLLKNNEDKAIRLLDSFWRGNSANSLYDIFLNEWLVNIYRFPGGIAMLLLQPYLHPGKSDWAQSHLSGWDVDDFDDSAEKGEDDLGNLVASCIPCIAIKGNVE
jgi:NTE family protein